MQFYSALAEYYDRVYNFVDYEEQAGFFERVWSQYGKTKDRSVVDFACGTGTHLSLLAQKGFSTYGVDASEDMLRLARLKCPQGRFVLADMVTVQLGTQCGLALCFFNSVLYAHPISSLRTMLENIRSHLQTGAVAVFDVVDKTAGLRDPGHEFTFNQDGVFISFKPRWEYRGTGEILDLHVDFQIRDHGREFHLHDHHEMCAIGIREVCALVTSVGMEAFCLERVFDQMREWEGSSKAAIIVARAL